MKTRRQFGHAELQNRTNGKTDNDLTLRDQASLSARLRSDGAAPSFNFQRFLRQETSARCVLGVTEHREHPFRYGMLATLPCRLAGRSDTRAGVSTMMRNRISVTPEELIISSSTVHNCDQYRANDYFTPSYINRYSLTFAFL